jgi:hypothetical protein
MIRNLKVLGLVLVALLAMTAVAVSAASADDLTSEASPVTLTGKQSGAGDVFTTTAGTVKCKEVSYTAISVGTPTTTVDVAPNYPLKTAGGEQNCAGFSLPAEIATNGCVYRLTIGAATTGGFDIVCPVGQEMTATAKGGATTKCTIHIPPQSIAAGVTFSNTGAGTTREVDIAANISGTLAYKHTAGTGLGACTSGSGSGSYAGSAIVTGENGGGAHVGIFLS